MDTSSVSSAEPWCEFGSHVELASPPVASADVFGIGLFGTYPMAGVRE
jgi:hypothetical protein